MRNYARKSFFRNQLKMGNLFFTNTATYFFEARQIPLFFLAFYVSTVRNVIASNFSFCFQLCTFSAKVFCKIIFLFSCFNLMKLNIIFHLIEIIVFIISYKMLFIFAGLFHFSYYYKQSFLILAK